jgi:hypothetical protein
MVGDLVGMEIQVEFSWTNRDGVVGIWEGRKEG